MTRNVVKFSLMATGIMLVGVGVIVLIQYLQYRTSPEYRAIQAIEKVKQQYVEDPYGGDTPEETLRLFIDALKIGDTDLAAKYFVLDKQQEWREDLAKIKEKGLLDNMIRDIERVKKTRNQETETFFTATNSNNLVSIQMIIAKNPQNRKWKIYEL